LETPIHLPPPAEQKRIVAKVEELLARVNAAQERLARVPAILKRFRQAVLAAACSGRLTGDWREEQEDLEPASTLLQRARGETKTAQNGREVDVSSLPETPDTWTRVYLPQLGYMNRGKSRHRPRDAEHLYGGPYPFIQTGDIAQSRGRITAHKQTYSEAGLAQSRLWPAGTVCITIAANIAESAILTYPACFPDSVVGLNPDPNLCLAEYAEFFIRTARDDLSQFAPATAQKNINIAILNEVAVPLPPLAEQHEIVRRVEALFKLADAIEKRVTAATARADKLTQAILAKAFRGELVPTEAELARREGRAYEPASALLERIQAERTAAPSSPSRRPARRRKS
jgi:type I restriction enzyme S subunit